MKCTPASIIAIDGPAASGKSSVAKEIARRLGYKFIGSGNLYRGVAWHADRLGVRTDDQLGIADMMMDLEPHIFVDGDDHMRFEIEGDDPVNDLMADHISTMASALALMPSVRAKVRFWLRKMAAFGNIIVEGRDIGSVVFPNATAKFYIDAPPEERARRRGKELADPNDEKALKEIADNIRARDDQDMNRPIAPLVIPEGAIVVDTTNRQVADVTDAVIAQLGEIIKLPHRH